MGSEADQGISPADEGVFRTILFSLRPEESRVISWDPAPDAFLVQWHPSALALSSFRDPPPTSASVLDCLAQDSYGYFPPPDTCPSLLSQIRALCTNSDMNPLMQPRGG